MKLDPERNTLLERDKDLTPVGTAPLRSRLRYCFRAASVSERMRNLIWRCV